MIDQVFQTDLFVYAQGDQTLSSSVTVVFGKKILMSTEPPRFKWVTHNISAQTALCQWSGVFDFYSESGQASTQVDAYIINYQVIKDHVLTSVNVRSPYLNDVANGFSVTFTAEVASSATYLDVVATGTIFIQS